MLVRFSLPRQYIQFCRPILCSDTVLGKIRFNATAKSDLKTDKKAEDTTKKVEDASIPDGMEGMPELFNRAEESLVFRDTTLGAILRHKEEDFNRQNRQLSGTKPSAPIFHISPGDLVFDGIKLMSEKKIGALLVRNKSRDDDPSDYSLDKYVGIFTERDYMNKVALKGLNSRTTRVEDIMTKSPIIASSDERCLSALQKMTHGRFRHIPVVQGNKIIGLISIGDLVKSLLISFTDSVRYYNDYLEGKFR
jgi:CBS domain-containing protein